MKKNFLSLLFFIALTLGALAQNQNSSNVAKAEQQKLEVLKGTYEIRANSRDMFTLPSNLSYIIESNRKEAETTTIQLNEYATLIIYPKNSIQNPKGNN
jgi:hypothetical protein